MWSGGYGATLCCGCVACLVAPLNALGGGLSICVKSIKPSEGLLQKETASQISPRRRKLDVKAVLMEMTT